jgi:DNA-binding CsgD family transcriptional regulator/tetratricopeptide (TPR) repeat protein
LDQPILERDAALAQLDGLARAASAGMGHFVLVAAEAGAGKTTLLRAFAERSGPARILRGACEDLSIPEPLGPLRDVADDLGVDLGALLDDEADRLAGFGRLLSLMTREGTATLLLIEDLHWADEATLDFLRFAARRVRDRPLLIVVTTRDGEAEGRPQVRRALAGVPPADVTRLPLPPLSAEAVVRMAREAGRDASDLHRITGGNAFYVSEMLRAGLGTGLRNVQDAVLGRTETLPPEARAVVEAVSIFPRRAERDWALEIADARDAHLDAALDAGLIEDGADHLTFRHEIARQAVETALRPSARRRLNARLLALMDRARDVPKARLMHHAREAGDRARTAHLAPLAGREALAAGANGQAADILALAVELTGDAADGRLLYDAGEACRLVGRLSQATTLLERARAVVRDSADPVLAARILQRLSRIFWTMGRKVSAREVGDQAIALLDGHESEDLAMALASRAQIAMSDYEMKRSLPLAERAEAMARRLGRMDIVGHALSTRSLAELFDRSRQNDLFAESIRVAEAARSAVNIPRCYNNAGVVRSYNLDFRGALALFDKAISLSFELDVTEQVDFFKGFRIQALDRLGEWDVALAEASAMVSEPLEQASPAIMARLAAARIGMRRGLPDDPDAIREIARRLGDEEDARHVFDVATLFVERAWLGLETEEVARGWLARSRAIALPPMLQEELLDWERRLGPDDPAVDLTGLHAPYRAALSGDWRGAAREWHAAGDPYREALMLAEGDGPAVAEALALLARLGAGAAAERVRAEALARGLTVEAPRAPRASTLANPAGLTRRQMDVLRLLDLGLSNAEIGARLFVSPKTVDHHVSAILGKLGVGTRGGAAARARAEGWIDAMDVDG